ncbi:MAG: ATP-binding protein, partial [Magnetococcales bacterium]|nr:ATP-binding protein [Magnetococcales bacterium]
ILSHRLQHSREASGNLAHAIRTPLTLLLQLTERPELEDHAQLRATMQQQIQTIDALTGRILKQVRVAGSHGASPPLDLGAELAVLVDMMHHMHRNRGVRIETRLPAGVMARVDREDWLELIGNLLDNGCKWARSTVRCHIIRADTLRIVVEDDGPGVPPSQEARLLERGARADPSVPGYGIGLAVVQEIVTAYHGTLTMGSSPELGGLRIQIDLHAQE